MIRLIATDLDGTLLTPQHQLPPGIFDMIRAFRGKGVRFAAASGRQYGNLKRLFAREAGGMDFICENGAYVVTRGKGSASWFPPDMVKEIARDILDAGMELLISAPETSYVLSSASREYTDAMVYLLRNTVTVIEDDSSVVGECIKISGYHPNGVAEIALPLQQKWEGKLHCDIAGRDWLDFTMVNKGDGIRALAEALDIPLAEIAAFGDQFNDDGMLQLVGHPYIMASAPEPLLKKGYAVCEQVMDTLSDLLRSMCV